MTAISFSHHGKAWHAGERGVGKCKKHEADASIKSGKGVTNVCHEQSHYSQQLFTEWCQLPSYYKSFFFRCFAEFA